MASIGVWAIDLSAVVVDDTKIALTTIPPSRTDNSVLVFMNLLAPFNY
jgi:hypothetical protein